MILRFLFFLGGGEGGWGESNYVQKNRRHQSIPSRDINDERIQIIQRYFEEISEKIGCGWQRPATTK